MQTPCLNGKNIVRRVQLCLTTRTSLNFSTCVLRYQSSIPDTNQRKSKLSVIQGKLLLKMEPLQPVQKISLLWSQFVSCVDLRGICYKPVQSLEECNMTQWTCGPERHLLHVYACPKFRGMQHGVHLEDTWHMYDCLGYNHLAKNCKSIHRCKIFHHLLLHIDRPHNITSTPVVTPTGTEAVNSAPDPSEWNHLFPHEYSPEIKFIVNDMLWTYQSSWWYLCRTSSTSW